MINRESVEKLLRYDPGTGEFFWRVSSSRTKAGSRAGTVNGHGYVQIQISSRLYQAHRLAWLLTHGVMPEGQIDHINGDRSDNRLTNLRLATPSLNQCNRGATSNNRTGFKGVHRHRRRFAAQIWHEGKKNHLGSFPTPEAAHAAYCKAASEMHGEFARAS